MSRFTHYFGRIQDFRADVGGLPHWARFIVMVLALPGLVLLVLSIVAFAVSLSALLLLTVPVYGLLRRLTAGREVTEVAGVKRVEATIVE
ncbi:MAG TPA: hypothetical protein VHD56_00590 [Tepidisphaeraceae bacterium]|nr:hypothetical protein [Tepidisphaeraceae bacterium]